jgi:hypothetical protein
MLVFTMFLLLTSLTLNSLAQLEFGATAFDSTATCVKRSVFIYTTDSSTVIVTNLGSTSFLPAPTFCPNATISTSTVTLYQPSPSSSSTNTTIVAVNTFNSSTVNGTASGPGVSARVTQGGVLQPTTGNNYL